MREQQKDKASRRASVVIAVLVVILVVGMLSMQTIQTLAIVRRGDDNRAKILQAKELNEFSRGIDWSTVESQSITMEIPDAVSSNAGGPAVEPETQTAIFERQTFADNPEAAKIVVRFPADNPGEVTTTWESHHE